MLDRVTNQMGDCPTPCETLLVNIGGKNRREKETELGEVNSFFFF